VAEALRDGRQSATALAIARGTSRLLWSLGLSVVPEVTLPNGRRADLLALSDKGAVTIVEIKSSIDDFRTDQKWPEYLDYCDRLLFAVEATFPQTLLPTEAGIIIADRYGAEIVRAAPEQTLPAARRKALTLRVARIACARLMNIADPEIGLEAPSRT
jgi:hypothetical protein